MLGQRINTETRVLLRNALTCPEELRPVERAETVTTEVARQLAGGATAGAPGLHTAADRAVLHERALAAQPRSVPH